ncbi:MAG: peptidase M61, partial [Nitrososphaerales archaeon]
MSQRIHYSISMPRPNTHYFDVSIEIPSAQQYSKNEQLRVVMPVWTPGSYLVREFSRNLLDLNALDTSNDSKLKCEKESKNKWAVTLDGAMTVKISYRVYAFEYTVDTSYLDTRHGVINGASVFPYVEGAEKET